MKLFHIMSLNLNVMGGIRIRKAQLFTFSTILFHFLILSTLIPSPQAEDDRQCFICNGESSPKCNEALSESDTEFLKKCPVVRGSEGKAIGCQMYGMKPVKYAYPRVFPPFWRDCLYKYELEKVYKIDRIDLRLPYDANGITSLASNFFIDDLWINDVNKWRDQVGLPKLPMIDGKHYQTRGQSVSAFTTPHEFWKVSNGIEPNASKSLFNLYTEMEPRPMKSVKCFVCTDQDPGCEAKLDASTGGAFIQECKGSTETTVPMGCQIVAGQYHYPQVGAVYFYRDCFYENYLSCYMKWYKWGFDRLSKWLGCLNKVREYVKGLQPYPTSHLPDDESKVHVALYHDLGHKITKYAVAEHGVSPLDLGNGEAIVDLKFEQRTPSHVKKKAYQCYVCDSRQDKWDSRCNDPRKYPVSWRPQNCTDNERAYGCFTLTEVDSSGKAVWVRRECWYNGYLYCLKGLQPPTGNGRSGDNCPKPEDKYKARELIDQGNRLIWSGTKVLNGLDAYERFRSCVDKVRIREGVTDRLPTLPEFDLGTAEKFFRYRYCAGRSKCNDKVTPNYLPHTTTSTTPKPPTTSPPGPPGGDECPEIDDLDDDECPVCPTCGAGFLLPNRIGMWSTCLVLAIGLTFPRLV